MDRTNLITLVLLAVLMAFGAWATPQHMTAPNMTGPMDRPIDTTSMKMFEASINRLGKELNDEQKNRFGNAMMALNVGPVIDGETPYDSEKAKADFLAMINGKTPNEIIRMAETASAGH